MRTNQRLAQLWLDALATELGASVGTIATYTDDLNCYLVSPSPLSPTLSRWLWTSLSFLTSPADAWSVSELARSDRPRSPQGARTGRFLLSDPHHSILSVGRSLAGRIAYLECTRSS